MYLDTLDSVRFNSSCYSVSDACDFAKASVMSNLTLGNSIILSQTQLLDTKFIIDSLGNPYFRKLFEDGFIRLSLHNRTSGNCVLKHLSMYYSAKTVFEYSMCQGDSYSQKNYGEALCALLQGDCAAANNIETLYQIKQILPFIVSLEKKWGFINAIKTDVSLGDLLLKHAIKTNDYTLKSLITLSGSQKDDRSYYYRWIKSFDSENQIKFKSIIDIYYNYVLGCSVQNNKNIELTAHENSVSAADWGVIKSVCGTNAGNFKKVEYDIVSPIALQKLQKVTWDILYSNLIQGNAGGQKRTLWNKILRFVTKNSEFTKVLITSGGEAIIVMCGMIPTAKKLIPLISVLSNGLVQCVDSLNPAQVDQLRKQINSDEISKLKGRIN